MGIGGAAPFIPTRVSVAAVLWRDVLGQGPGSVPAHLVQSEATRPEPSGVRGGAAQNEAGCQAGQLTVLNPWFRVGPGEAVAGNDLPARIGGSLLGSGNDLRQMAEMGLAAVGIDYCQTNEAVFEAQFVALLEWLGRQSWADADRMGWVGYSLGAQRSLAFALNHPTQRPRLLIRLAGGWVPGLDSKTQSLRPGITIPESKLAAAGNNAAGPMSVLLMHGEQDEVFPLDDARRVAECLRSNGVPVELQVLPGLDHGLKGNRLQVFRAFGEYSLTRFNGPEALRDYRSILWWQAQARPLWIYWLPALAWGSAWAYGRNRRSGLRFRSPEPLPWRKWEIALRWVAVALAAAATGQTALHLIPPRLAVGRQTLEIARRHLVQPKEMADFEFLASNPAWHGRRLKILLEHVQLANYNRELINWKLDEETYRDFVLSPLIEPAADGEMNWRRPLWENFYPRIRKEQTTEAAAEIVARFLRERLTISRSGAFPETIEQIWQQQIASPKGFEAVYVAALRAAGIPARLDGYGCAEFWTGSGWRRAPKPAVEQMNQAPTT